MIKDIIHKVLSELNLNGLSEDERFEVMANLMDHFNGIIIQTVMANLNDEQLAEFNAILEKDESEEREEEIAQLVARIPGVDMKIEEALQNEIDTLKASKAIIDS